MDGPIPEAMAIDTPERDAALPLPKPADMSNTVSLPDTQPQPRPVSSPAPAVQAPNGHDHAGEDENNNDDLSPPPDSPAGDTMSPEPSLPVNTLHDEIVVGTNANGNGGKSSPLGIASDQEDEMDEQPDDEGEAEASHYPKRKRSAIFDDLSEDKIESSLIDEEPESDLVPGPVPRPKTARQARAHGTGGVKGVVLGFWRDSEVPDDKDKHSVIGFIDVRDRLRTRVQPTTRYGKNMSNLYPLPPGPGGSWVTFEKVAFDPHLVNLDHYQVKEYVKIRAETIRRDETPEEQEMRNKEAVAEALQRLRENPPPDNGPPPPMAYGPQIPAHAQMPHRPESKKRRIASGLAVSSAASTPARLHQADRSAGTRPTRILLGYWAHSSEENDIDKHAIYGILGSNDMFRLKIARETRDGRPLLGNFPSGPGALWIQWEDAVFEKHVEKLDRNQVKEYCKIRQRQLDEGEQPGERHENELEAVREAMERVSSNFHGKRANISHGDLSAMKGQSNINGTSPEGNMAEFITPGQGRTAMSASETHRGLRNSHRESGPRGRHSLPDVQLRAANRPQNVDALGHSGSSLNLGEPAGVEAIQMRGDHRPAGSRESSVPSSSFFQDSVLRLNKVWAAQEASRLREAADDAKIYMGTKYERKESGPFEGKLVSQGHLITIDGEDYVEYRVLTKPSFF